MSLYLLDTTLAAESSGVSSFEKQQVLRLGRAQLGASSLRMTMRKNNTSCTVTVRAAQGDGKCHLVHRDLLWLHIPAADLEVGRSFAEVGRTVEHSQIARLAGKQRNEVVGEEPGNDILAIAL